MSTRFMRTAIALCGALVVGRSSLVAQIARVSVDSAGAQSNGTSGSPSVSANGQVVAFYSFATNLVDGDTNQQPDIFVHDLATGRTELVTVSTSGVQADNMSDAPSLSGDGSIVTYWSFATTLVPNDTNQFADVFLRDRNNGLTEMVSVDRNGAPGDGGSFFPAISSDGRFVAFLSDATTLVTGDTNGRRDVFVRDRTTGITECISVTPSGAPANDHSERTAISADGRFVAFASRASDLVSGDTNGRTDVFVRDRATGATERVSVDSSLQQADGDSVWPSLSADGQTVAFCSQATDLVAGDTNGLADIFVHDRATGLTVRASVDSSGAQGFSDWSLFSGPSLSADGRRVAFESTATNLVDGDTNGSEDVFVHQLSSGRTLRASVDSSGAQTDRGSDMPSLSADGSTLVFRSAATNLVAGDTNRSGDVFASDLRSIANWSNYGTGFSGTDGVPTFAAATDPILGTALTIDLANSSGTYTVGALFLGFEPTILHSSWGGDLLVVPVVTQLVGLSPWGATLVGDLPDDATLAGLEVDLQAFELDAGADRGISFTRGLQLDLGR